jgi:signal transduction histidine kinase
VFVAIVAAGVRVELARAVWVAVVGTVALAIGDIIYSNVGLGLLAYTLGFAASILAASTSRQAAERAEQAELLLAQTQRSHEEQVRAAGLEESARIAREIHDVLAHALAGLTIQLEATIKTHINHVFSKIGARDRAQAVHYAYTHGLAG